MSFEGSDKIDQQSDTKDDKIDKEFSNEKISVDSIHKYSEEYR